MSELFEVKKVDKKFYEEKLKDFLPEKIIDIHTHVWTDERPREQDARTVSWPSMVAATNPIEDLLETYNLMFPGKNVTPMIFGTLPNGISLDAENEYVKDCAFKHNFPSLIFSDPAWRAEEYEKKIIEGSFLGAKSYLTMADKNIPDDEITIFDFFPRHQLDILDKHGWIMMLHIPRSGRLKDPKNLAQIIEIDKKYPNIKLIVAHVGRAYCNEDIGNAFNILKETQKVYFDFSANTNDWIFERLIDAVGPKRILFGSDMPILRMRSRRIIENNAYINLVPKGLYGDVSADSHMRELEEKEAEKITFFMYEEIDAFRRASKKTGMSSKDIEDIFYNNSKQIIDNAKDIK